MPVIEKTTIEIVCDNPQCPGGSALDPADRTGWTFITSEVYGQTSAQSVYCSPECAGAITLVLNPPVELPPPEPG